MRTWIEYLISNEASYADFQKWLEGVSQTLIRKIIECAKTANTKELERAAIELHIYDNMRQRFSAEHKERNSYNNFLETKGA